MFERIIVPLKGVIKPGILQSNSTKIGNSTDKVDVILGEAARLPGVHSYYSYDFLSELNWNGQD